MSCVRCGEAVEDSALVAAVCDGCTVELAREAADELAVLA